MSSDFDLFSLDFFGDFFMKFPKIQIHSKELLEAVIHVLSTEFSLSPGRQTAQPPSMKTSVIHGKDSPTVTYTFQKKNTSHDV